MFKLTQASATELTVSDLKNIHKAALASYYGHEGKHLLPWIVDGRMTVWRGEGDGADFVILTVTNDYPGGKELYVWSLAGKGYIEHLPSCYERLKEYAEGLGCRWISGYIDRRGFARIYKNIEPIKKYHLWMKELSDV